MQLDVACVARLPGAQRSSGPTLPFVLEERADDIAQASGTARWVQRNVNGLGALASLLCFGWLTDVSHLVPVAGLGGAAGTWVQLPGGLRHRPQDRTARS